MLAAFSKAQQSLYADLPFGVLQNASGRLRMAVLRIVIASSKYLDDFSNTGQ